MRRVVVVAHKQQSVEGFVGGGEDPQEVAPVAQLEEFFPLSYMARATDSQNIFPLRYLSKLTQIHAFSLLVCLNGSRVLAAHEWRAQ